MRVHALVAKCTSNFLSELWFDIRLWQHARASSCLKWVSDMRLWINAQASSRLECVLDLRTDMRLWQDLQVCSRLKSVSDMRLWQNAQARPCLKCVSNLRLWQNAQASSRQKRVSDMRLWRIHKQFLSVHALRQSCERFWRPTSVPCTLFSKAVSDFLEVHSRCTRETLEELSRQHISENQPEYVRKAAGARQHLSKAGYSTFERRLLHDSTCRTTLLLICVLGAEYSCFTL